MLKPNYALDFQPICTFFPWGEGIEDTELQPFLDFSQFCPLSPWERVRERAVSRRLTFRFRKKSSESSLQQEIAHSETVAANFICVQDKRKVV
ncbi:hypothetical protein HMPREF1028_01288 [Neisseria sp. GT4A_CT1]|nr:hypothetical protein HMPREF1028_01288 [Neisseria sp. GT4A_CT1]